jgi:regulator of RNase E activity RraA
MKSAAAADALTLRLEKCYTGVVHDVMRAMGCFNFVLPPEIRPILPDKTLAGPIFTVSGHLDRDADAHTTLFEWTGLLSKARAGHVVISQPNDHTVAHMGELSAETLQLRGIRGYVTDGGARDVRFLVDMGFQTFCRYFTPLDIVGMWLPDGFDVPIEIGGVAIRPGDYMLGDRDGICIIPRDQVEAIVSAAEEAVATENKVRSAILAGTDPQQAYLQFGKF